MVEKTFLPTLINEQLCDETKYEYVYYENLNTIKDQLRRHCVDVAEAYNDKDMKRTLVNKVSYANANSIMQNVLFNVKTHTRRRSKYQIDPLR